MDSSKRKLRPRAKSTNDRTDLAVSFGYKRQHSPGLDARKKKEKSKGKLQREDVSAKRLGVVGASNTTQSILKKMQSNKENESSNMPEIVIRNCKFTNTLFDMNKQLVEKNENILKLNVQLCNAKVENADLKNEHNAKESEAVIQLHKELTVTKIENANLKIELIEKKREIDELKRTFENENVCSDLIHSDKSNEGMLIIIFRS